jgi:hypothetical protein
MDIDHVKSQFLSAYETATLTVLHDDGLYRHIRIQGQHYYRFDLVTWPGSLFVNCEGDGYAFARTEDMFAFFRMGVGVETLRPNLSYWAEKLYDPRSRKVREHDASLFERDVEAVLATIGDEQRVKAIRLDLELETNPDHEDSCWTFIAEHKEFRHLEGEGDWQDWTFRYAYACFAILFGIREYDRHKQAVGAASGAQSADEPARGVAA